MTPPWSHRLDTRGRCLPIFQLNGANYSFSLTTDPEVAKVLKRWKGIEEVASGVNFFMKQYSVPGYKIDRVLRLANLPPRKIPQWKVEQGKRLSRTVEKVAV